MTKLVMAKNLEFKVISKCTVIILKSKPELKFAVIFFFSVKVRRFIISYTCF